MNTWLQFSLEYANQRSYLDDLFRVYPTIPEGIREIDQDIWRDVEKAFIAKDDIALLKGLLRLKLFPLKDPYVAYLRRDPSAITRNPRTVHRLCGRLYEMGLAEMYRRCSEPKEMNRQIGPMFRRWIRQGALGLTPMKPHEFSASDEDAIMDASDAEMREFAATHLGYTLDKGLDLVARIHGHYVIGEAKFLTDFGGHQNAQFNDAVRLFALDSLRAVPVAILDGVLYIPGRHKLYRQITGEYSDKNIMSALVLREFLYQL